MPPRETSSLCSLCDHETTRQRLIHIANAARWFDHAMSTVKNKRPKYTPSIIYYLVYASQHTRLIATKKRTRGRKIMTKNKQTEQTGGQKEGGSRTAQETFWNNVKGNTEQTSRQHYNRNKADDAMRNQRRGQQQILILGFKWPNCCCRDDAQLSGFRLACSGWERWERSRAFYNHE